MSEKRFELEECVADGPQSTLEKKLVEEYLESKGYSIKDLPKLPVETARQLMREACAFASLKLAELEAKSKFRQEIRPPT
jgi:hypothetical protein